MKNPSTTEADRYWRSAEERAGDPAFRDLVDREFLDDAPDTNVTRRGFLGIMGAAAALAGLAGCSRPVSKILPYSRMPEQLVPGIPQHYATNWSWRGAAEGLLVTSHEGRPTKIEGNPEHPVNRGTTDLVTQALILSLYDPDRAAAVKRDGAESDWDAFAAWVAGQRPAWEANGGAGLRFLAPLSASPTEAALRERLSAAFPDAVWHAWEPVNRDAELAGARRAFGRPLRTHVDYAAADVILSLDADFLGTGVNAVPAARGFAEGRRVTSETDDMNRLYVVEPHFSITGSMADHRVPLSHARVAEFAGALAARLAGANRVSLDGLEDAVAAGEWSAGETEVLDALAHDLAANRGRCVVVAGRTQPAEVHALVHALNRALGAVGPVVRYTAEPLPADTAGSMADLAAALDGGSVETLFLLGGNPVYDTPGDIDFAALMGRAGTVVRLGLYEDESSAGVSWFLPEAHPLECWSDATAYDGTRGVQQPLIAPLHGGHGALEVLDLVLGGSFRGDAGHEMVRRTWLAELGGSTDRMKRVLHEGFLAGSAWSTETPGVRSAEVARAWSGRRPAPRGADAFEIVFREDPKLYDGRFANLAWLQECPDPMTKITWDNPVLMAPAAARRLGVESGDLVRVTVGEREQDMPVWVQPGHAEGSLTVFLGYGRTAAGRVGTGVGFDVNPLRRTAAPWVDHGASVQPTGAKYPLASTQNHWVMEDRPLAREGTLAHYREHPDFVEHMEENPGDYTMYLDREYDFTEGYQWGMSVDLNTCTGCNACVVACQSENNIPSVGKDQVLRGREMHWIRIDRYFVGDEDNPHTVQQPLPCQQCENAPCEAVCPVNATAHNSEGMNDMVYNRCIGTRYCANNCPYKVRRFNFYDYNDGITEVGKMQKNPNVTVRMRGVMEKCTFCVQRVNRARIDAKLEDRSIRDGDVVTACQQACPTRAIEFGDINDPDSRIARAKAENRDYAMLEWLNTKPRTTYRARLRNPNPELEQHS